MLDKDAERTDESEQMREVGETHGRGRLSSRHLLKLALERTPAVKYAVAVAVIAGLVATTFQYGLSAPMLVFGVIVCVGLMVLFFAFSQLTKASSRSRSAAGQFVLWSFLLLSVGSATLLFVSAFFDQPLPLRTQILGVSPVLTDAAPEITSEQLDDRQMNEPPNAGDSRTKPNFSVEATIETLDNDVNGGEGSRALSIHVVNRGGPAANTEVQCFADAELWLHKKRGGYAHTYSLGCDDVTYYNSYNPDDLDPRVVGSRVDDIIPDFNRMAATEGLSSEVRLHAWLALNYDDAEGGHHKRFFELYTFRVPPSDPSVKIISPAAFDDAKRKNERLPAWPCDGEIDFSECVVQIYTKVSHDLKR